MSVITIINDLRFLDHDTGGGDHPEVPERISVIQRAFEKSVLAPRMESRKTRSAERVNLLAAHDESWLFRFEESVLSGKTFIDHTDNQVGYHSWEVALLAAGAGLEGIDLIENGQAEQVFCLVRPPGHHAEFRFPFGFCFINNCVVAARYWRKRYNRRRIAIIDFDAHHGNGIQSAFEEEPDFLYISIHEHPSFSYPGTGYAEDTGIGAGFGTILNIPLSPGSGDSTVLFVLDEKIRPRIEQFRPDAIIVAAGFDGHRQDDMSGLHYSTSLYGKIGMKVREWALSFCGGKQLSILEGGYELSVLGKSAVAYVGGLLAE